MNDERVDIHISLCFLVPIVAFACGMGIGFIAMEGKWQNAIANNLVSISTNTVQQINVRIIRPEVEK